MKQVLDKKKTIKELEKLAKEILKLKHERGQRRPLIIEFCGSPKAGKSTTITSLNIFLKRNEFKTVVLTERASVCPIENKAHPFFNLWTMSSAVAEIVKHLEGGAGKTDIIISDRGIFDSLCWFEWLNKQSVKNLDDKTYGGIRQFILTDMWRDYIDLIYIFKVKPEASIRREYSLLLTEKRGSIMTEQILSDFNKAVSNVHELYGKYFRNIQVIETDTPETDDDPNNVGYYVTNQILTSLRDLLIEKIGYLPHVFSKKLKYGINKIDLLDNQEIFFDNRDKVEARDFIQPIAIVVITNTKRTKALVVKKGVKRTSVDSPERDKLLVYIGGHIRLEDMRESTMSTLKQTLHREIQEEIGESITIGENNPFLIYTPDNAISRKHLAVCFIVEMDLEDKKIKLVSDEFVMKTGTTKSGHVLKISEIITGKDKPENWSRVILKHVFKAKIPLIKSAETISLFNDDF
jgi:predicted NUDIX family phosphoesterase